MPAAQAASPTSSKPPVPMSETNDLRFILTTPDLCVAELPCGKEFLSQDCAGGGLRAQDRWGMLDERIEIEGFRRRSDIMIRFSFGETSLLTVLLGLVSCPSLEAAPDSRSVFRSGFAERDISPAIGMEEPGGYGKAFHEAFHDPCKARAVVFDDGKTRVAIVGIDALFIRRQTVQAVRSAIKKRCGMSRV